MIIFVVELIFMCPTYGEAKHTKMSDFGTKEVLLQGQAKRAEQLMLKRPELLDGFQRSNFNGKVREWSRKVCDQLVHNFLIC